MTWTGSLAPALGFLLCASTAAAQPKLKVIVDQDARGPCTTDIQSILMFVKSPQVDVLGITIVSGDLWMEQELRHTLRALEIAGRTDVPVYRGAVFPLVHTQDEAKRWEARLREAAVSRSLGRRGGTLRRRSSP